MVPQFNARCETVPEKGVFKRLLSRQRCVVLLNGFYEWAKVSCRVLSSLAPLLNTKAGNA